jgi:predicted dehydrogenase
MKDRIIRVGIAGQGRSGYNIHGKCLSMHETDKFKITAVADQMPERRRDAENEFGARAYDDYAKLIRAGGFDLFVNALPSPLHVPATIQALKTGYHVLCEKPMAKSVAEFDKMVAAAKQCKRHLFAFQNNRPQPFFRKILEVVDSGVLGEIIHVRSNWSHFSRRWDWQTFQVNMGGTLYNTGPHAIDQALMMFPFSVKPKVFCRMECKNKLGGDAEDFCALTIYGKGAPTIEIIISQYLAYPMEARYNICGTLGGLSGNEGELRWKYYDPKKAPKQKLWGLWSVDRRYPPETLPWVEKTWKIDAETAKSAVGYTLRSFSSGPQAIYNNMYNVIHGKEKPFITLPQVRRQIAIMEEAHRQNHLPRKANRWPIKK